MISIRHVDLPVRLTHFLSMHVLIVYPSVIIMHLILMFMVRLVIRLYLLYDEKKRKKFEKTRKKWVDNMVKKNS